jgi:hypothetical protein
MTIVGGFAIQAATTTVADPVQFGSNTQPLVLGGEMAWLMGQVTNGIIASYSIPSSDPFYGLMSQRCYLYDQALALLASLAYRATKPQDCQTLATGLVGLAANGVFPFAVSVASGQPFDTQYRNLTQSWCLIALTLYQFFFPTNPLSTQIQTFLTQGLNKLVSQASPQWGGMITVGHGIYGATYLDTDVLDVQVETNFMAWFALMMGYQMYNNPAWLNQSNKISNTLMEIFWQQGTFLNGTSGNGMDTANPLINNTLGALWLLSNNYPEQAIQVSNNIGLFALATQTDTSTASGYCPYLAAQGYPGVPPSICSEMTFMAAETMRRLYGDGTGDQIGAALVPLRGMDNGWSYSRNYSGNTNQYNVASWESVSGTAWAILSMNSNIRNIFLDTTSGVSSAPSQAEIIINPSAFDSYSGEVTTLSASGSVSSSMVWKVDDVIGGNATVGTITGNGANVSYTAPAINGSHTITCVNPVNSTVSGSSTASIQALVPVTITLNPSSLNIFGGSTTSLVANVANGSTSEVTWKVDGVVNGNSTVGTITGSGESVNYVAPSTPGTHSIIVTSVDDPTKSATSVLTVSVVSISLTPGAAHIGQDATLTLTATITGTTAIGVSWYVDDVLNGNSTLGTISSSGTVAIYTAPTAGGSHIIRCTSVADPSKSAYTAVGITPTGVSLSALPSSVLQSGTSTLLASVTGALNTNVTWTVDGITGGNSTVGTLSGNGLSNTYTAPNSAGTHSITVTSVADSTQSATITLTVTPTATVSVSLNQSTANLSEGAVTSLTATVSGSSNQLVTWTVDGIISGNSSVGTITGNSNTISYTAPTVSGSHTVTATSVADNTQSASAVITITVPSSVISVGLSPSVASVLSTATQSLNATVTVTGNETQAVTWTVDNIVGGNLTVGTISGSGSTVTYNPPPTAGSHTIKATSVGNSNFYGSSIITVSLPVINAVTGLTLNPTSFTVLEGGTQSITATVTTTGTEANTLTWNVDGITNGSSRVGTITGTGSTITYTAPSAIGSHNIEAVSTFDNTKNATCTATVQSPSTGTTTVSLSPSAPTAVGSGGTIQFSAVVTGSGNPNASWSVDGIPGGNSTTHP